MAILRGLIGFGGVMIVLRARWDVEKQLHSTASRRDLFGMYFSRTQMADKISIYLIYSI